jgi:hypothetical protein
MKDIIHSEHRGMGDNGIYKGGLGEKLDGRA